MNRLPFAIAALALAGPSAAALAAQPAESELAVDANAPAAGEYEEVDSIPALTRPYSFRALDRDTLIIWRTRRDPYLVELRFPSPDLPFAWSIGVGSSVGRIHARFDDVHVDGLRYPIDRIYRLEPAEAERLSEAS